MILNICNGQDSRAIVSTDNITGRSGMAAGEHVV